MKKTKDKHPSFEQISRAPCLKHNPMAFALVRQPSVEQTPFAPCLFTEGERQRKPVQTDQFA